MLKSILYSVACTVDSMWPIVRVARSCRSLMVKSLLWYCLKLLSVWSRGDFFSSHTIFKVLYMYVCWQILKSAVTELLNYCILNCALIRLSCSHKFINPYSFACMLFSIHQSHSLLKTVQPMVWATISVKWNVSSMLEVSTVHAEM